MPNTSPTCLLVEDDPTLNTTLARALKRFLRVDQVTTLAGAFEYLIEREKGYDVVVVDRTLPDGDGLDLLTGLHTDFPHTKVCVLTGLIQESAQIAGLRLGADLYLCKPLSTACVSEHIKVLLRRGSLTGDTLLRWQDLALDAETNVLTRQTDEIHLTPREAECLKIFFTSQEGRVARQDLTRLLWTTGQLSSVGILHVNIQRLRQKLRQLGVTIQAHYGAGYQLRMVTT